MDLKEEQRYQECVKRSGWVYYECRQEGFDHDYCKKDMEDVQENCLQISKERNKGRRIRWMKHK